MRKTKQVFKYNKTGDEKIKNETNSNLALME